MSKKTIKERVIDYFKKKGRYKKYKEDGSLERRIKRGVQMAKAKEKEEESELVGTMDDLYNEVIIPGITNKLNPAKRKKVVSILNSNRKKQGLPLLKQSPHKHTGQRPLTTKKQVEKNKIPTQGHRIGGAVDLLSDDYSAVDLQFIKDNPELGMRGIDERNPGRPKNIVHVDLMGASLDPIEQSYVDYVGMPESTYKRKGGTVLEEHKERKYRSSKKDYKQEAAKAIQSKQTREFLQPDIEEKSKRLKSMALTSLLTR